MDDTIPKPDVISEAKVGQLVWAEEPNEALPYVPGTAFQYDPFEGEDVYVADEPSDDLPAIDGDENADYEAIPEEDASAPFDGFKVTLHRETMKMTTSENLSAKALLCSTTGKSATSMHKSTRDLLRDVRSHGRSETGLNKGVLQTVIDNQKRTEELIAGMVNRQIDLQNQVQDIQTSLRNLLAILPAIRSIAPTGNLILRRSTDN
jgi:hypothetical protein